MSAKIEIHCAKCEKRNEMAERLISRLQRQLRDTDSRYDSFKDAAKLAFARKSGFIEWFFRGFR